MTYAAGRLIHDADSHIMELDGCLDPWMEQRHLTAFHALPIYQRKLSPQGWADPFRRKHDDPAFRAGDADNLLLRKNYDALGAFRRDDRPKAIDLFGFASQLVFTTFCLGNFGLDESGDLELCYAAASAHNRMMTDFCSADRRLLATAYVPLVDFERAAATAREAIE
ncbi:MAG: amidohydrolase, partial [Caulobacteraceae bacterium]